MRITLHITTAEAREIVISKACERFNVRPEDVEIAGCLDNVNHVLAMLDILSYARRMYKQDASDKIKVIKYIYEQGKARKLGISLGEAKAFGELLF